MLLTTLSGFLEEDDREWREDRKPSKTGGPYKFLLRAFPAKFCEPSKPPRTKRNS